MPGRGRLTRSLDAITRALSGRGESSNTGRRRTGRMARTSSAAAPDSGAPRGGRQRRGSRRRSPSPQ